MDVEQRIGPAGIARAAVAPLIAVAVATQRDAARVRREFRRWIADVADPDTADDLTLAVYEALANVVDHAYPGSDPGRPMRLWAAVSAPLPTGRALVVTVSDDGEWRDAHDPGFRGRGLPLVHSLTTASVLVSARGTTVQMRRRVAPEGLEGPAGLEYAATPPHTRAAGAHRARAARIAAGV